MTIPPLSRRRLLFCSAALAAGAAAPAMARAAPVYRNASAPVGERVADLVARMTLDEKVAQLRGLWVGKSGLLNPDGSFAPEKARQALAGGIGQIGRPSDFMGTPRMASDRFREPVDGARFVNAVQRLLVEETRLGIPALFHEETAHGLMARDATVFPIPPALASTWDVELVEQVFTVSARQARGRGATIGLSPVLDLMREPRFGRTEEFFGEDPYLAGQMSVAAVRGLQGRSRPLADDRVFATLKHFIHGSPQGGLNLSPADLNQRTLRETYFVPFAETIRVADPAIVMPSYNEVEGVPAHASKALLEGAGRDLMGFKGLYMSDYNAVRNLIDHHHVAADAAGAAAIAINAGVDVELPEGTTFTRLPELVRQGQVSEARIDEAVGRVLALKFEAGLFEHPYVDEARAARSVDTPADAALARKAAEKALILLRNDGVLPLDPSKTMKLAVIGPNAEAPMFGGYSGANERATGILAGVRAAAGPGVVVGYAEGVRITEHREHGDFLSPMRPVPPADNEARIREAEALARGSDVILLVLGDNEDVTREALTVTRPTDGRRVTMAGDRNDLGLYGDQDRLVEAMLATGKPVIALILAGRPLAVTRLADKASALIYGWYLGQEAGPAFADVLFGRASPGGKLTVSIPRAAGDLPIYYNRHPSAEANAYLSGPRTPLYPFGFGLGYTRFELSEPRLAQAEIAAGGSVGVEVDVTNAGDRAGDEVVQLYLRDEVSSAPRPVKELKGFQRVSLAPGERRTVRFDLRPDDLAFWNIDMEWKVEPGTFLISTGASSAELKSVRLTVTA